MLNWTMQSDQIAAQALCYHDIPYPRNVATNSTHMCWLTTCCNNLQLGYATCNITVWCHHQLHQCRSIVAYNQCCSIAAYNHCRSICDQCRSIAAYVTTWAVPQIILDYLLMVYKLHGPYCASCAARARCVAHASCSSCVAHASCASSVMFCHTAWPSRLVTHYVYHMLCSLNHRLITIVPCWIGVILKMNNLLDHSSPLKRFWTTKSLNHSASKWGYNSLTFPISIHLTLLGWMPLSPTWRYSTFPLRESLIFLSRITSSCNSFMYSCAISSTEGICMLVSSSMIIGGSYSLRFSTLTNE